MAGDIFETLGIFDAESEEISQMENVNCLNIELITEKVQSLTAISSDSNTQRLLGTVATDPVSGESRHFCKKIPGFSSAERFCNHDRSFLRMIEATERRFPDLSTGPVYGEKSVDEAICDSQLWVEKYAPQKFTDLVSNDKVNVEVLKWVSQWKQMEEKMRTAAKGTDPRPEKKIMLISGPPGFGKTTLCQVITIVAGYNLVEINASDERTGDSVTQKIDTAIGSNTLFARPNLVMIDEIDGAANTGSDASLIGYLVKLCGPVQSAKTDKGGGDDSIEGGEESLLDIEGPKPGEKKKRKGSKFLCRPIICICNNLYAPALKPLRQVAHIVQLRKPSPVMLSKRLKVICDLEGFKVDNKSLVDLCEMMECDLRSCLHALQFLSTTKKQLLGASDLFKTLSSGLKDIGRTEHSVIELIFTHRTRPNSTNLCRNAELDSMIQHISKDHDQILDYCHQIFLHSRFFDDSQLTKVNFAYEWLGTADIWRSSAKAQYQLMPFVQCAPIRFSSLFASPTPLEPFAFKKSDFEISLKSKRNQSILQDYLHGISPQARATSGGLEELLTDRAPLLQRIIKPSLKAPNPQLLKPGEKLQLARIVRTMAAENITYHETRCEDGTYFMSMDPAIDKLTKIGTEPPQISQHDSAIRKLIAHEVVQDRIRSLQERRGFMKPEAPNKGKTIPAKRKEVPTTAKAVKRDFFGRIISVIEEPETDPCRDQQLAAKSLKVCYRFNEGFSNAVRRNIRIKDLFPAQFK